MSKKTHSGFQEPLFQDLNRSALHDVETVGPEAAEKYSFEVLDFSNPDRPKACIEVDFPILRVNEIAAIEANATKPIYMMSKWWARRRSSVFRQLLISSATKAPKNAEEAAQVSWTQMYRKNHKAHGKFGHIKVADIFMGGGTTVVEASRLGCDVVATDINPIAWWVTHNEISPVDPEKILEFEQYIEAHAKPQLAPYFCASSPRGFDGKWIDSQTGSAVDIVVADLPAEERKRYRWDGPELIYTFWMKHILCSDPSCFHLTPQANSTIAAEKSLKIKYWSNCVCPSCGQPFDLEHSEFRMAPTAKFVVSEKEPIFASINVQNGKSSCPHCSKPLSAEWVVSQQSKKGKPVSKDVSHSLLISKEWLKGLSGDAKSSFGGYYGATRDQDDRWFNERSQGLGLIEVRGEIPDEYRHSNFVQKTNQAGEAKSTGEIICGGCGRTQDPLTSIKLSGHLAPMFPYLIQGFDPKAKELGFPYGGRFFDIPNIQGIQDSIKELSVRSDLAEWIPETDLFFGHQTHQRTNLPAHGYSKWKHMFNPRQLLVHGILLRTIMDAPPEQFGAEVKSHALGAFQNYLRHNCMFSIWDISRDGLAPHFSNNDYHPKATTVENGVFSDLGRGNFSSCITNVREGIEFALNPYDIRLAKDGEKGKSVKVGSADAVTNSKVRLFCASSTDLKQSIADGSIDLVITDPPFGDNINYSELADFFLVWLWKPLRVLFGEQFNSPESPKTLEAISNKARHPGEAEGGKRQSDVMYDRLLTLCWREAARILRPSGLLVFTFHHNEDTAWIGVLESLFKAGFTIEATFPIRSDSQKGDGDFGSRKIEFDIVHVCKKRSGEPTETYWATLRKKIVESVRGSASILAQHRAAGLHLADLEVMIRGEVLEQYSKHFGKVKKNLGGDTMDVRQILLEANSIALSLLQLEESDRVPETISPEARTLFGLLREGPSIERNAASKRLKGSGVTLDELMELGWLEITRSGSERIVKAVSISDRWNSLARKTQLKLDLDQVHFAINCCIGGRQLEGKPADWEEWILENYKLLLPSVGPILKYIENNHFGSDYKQAIGIAHRTLERTLQRIKENDGEFRKASEQMDLF